MRGSSRPPFPHTGTTRISVGQVDAREFVSASRVSQAQLTHGIFAGAPDALVQLLGAGVEAADRHLFPAPTRHLRRQHTIFDVAETQLSFDIPAPTPKIGVTVHRAGVKRIERHLSVLARVDAGGARVIFGVIRAQVAVRVLAPTPEVTRGSQATRVVLASLDLDPVRSALDLLRRAILHGRVFPEPELVTGVAPPAPERARNAQAAGMPLPRIHT